MLTALYEWRYGVGDIDKRPSIFDPVWHAVQPNDVATDEFLTLCRLLGVDPYITVNAGFGDAWSARELVEYTNGIATTPMGKWRAQDGLRFDAARLHNILDDYGVANSFEIYSGTHTSAVADRFQNHVLPFFSKNLCFTADCR